MRKQPLGSNPFVSNQHLAPTQHRGPAARQQPPAHGQQHLATPFGLHARAPSAGQMPPRQPMHRTSEPRVAPGAQQRANLMRFMDAQETGIRRVIDMQGRQTAHATAVAMSFAAAARARTYEDQLAEAMAILDLSVQHEQEMAAAMAQLSQGLSHPVASSRLSPEAAMQEARETMNDLSYESAMASAASEMNDLSYESAFAEAESLLADRFGSNPFEAVHVELGNSSYEHYLVMTMAEMNWSSRRPA